MKKTSIFVLVLAFILTTGTCFAEELGPYEFPEQDPSTAVDISLDTETVCELKGPEDAALFRFVPEESCEYLFYSENLLDDVAYDTYGQITEYMSSEEDYDPIEMDDNSGSGKHFMVSYDLDAGTTYYLRVKLVSGSGRFAVRIVKDPIDTIDLELSSPRKLVRGENMEYDSEYNTKVYRFPGYKAGDKIHISYTDGSSDTFVYDAKADQFEGQAGGIIAPADITVGPYFEGDGEWDLGGHLYILKYRGQYFDYDVEVVNEIVPSYSEIQYHPNVLSFPINDYSRGREITDSTGTWFKYECWPNVGDYLLLVTQDGDELRYNCEKHGDEFVFRDAQGNVLPGTVVFSDDQVDNHWTEYNRSYDVTVEYEDNSCILKVYLEEPFVEPLPNTLKVTPSSKKISLKAKALKKKAKVVKPFAVKDNQGKVSYKVSVKGKSKKYLSFKKGKLTIKKGTKKGKYTMTVTVTAAGTREYLKGQKKCKITVVVK